ncbi:MAG: LysR substrate-binding domain-containing protein [Marinibacterium sp.]|nr:LysR substrate-binding domain-containing protein [Marinibacterium sp.]
MNGLTLKHCRYFLALAREAHFGRAAAACAISQPALSLQIKELEQMLGAALVERSGRQIRLTSLGRAFAVRVEDILRSVDDLGNLVRASRDALSGPFRLGIIPTIAPYLLPAVMAQLTARFPGLDVYVRETITPRLEQDIRSGDLDAAILALPISEPDLTEVSLISEDFVLVRPKGDADRPVPDAKALREMRLLLLEEGHCFRDQALSFCEMGNATPREQMDGSSLTTLVQMVAAGIGVTLIPEMAVPIETRSASVSVARFDAPRPSRRIGMIWRRSNPLEQQLMLMSGTVREAALALRAQQA